MAIFRKSIMKKSFGEIVTETKLKEHEDYARVIGTIEGTIFFLHAIWGSTKKEEIIEYVMQNVDMGDFIIEKNEVREIYDKMQIHANESKR